MTFDVEKALHGLNDMTYPELLAARTRFLWEQEEADAQTLRHRSAHYDDPLRKAFREAVDSLAQEKREAKKKAEVDRQQRALEAQREADEKARAQWRAQMEQHEKIMREREQREEALRLAQLQEASPKLVDNVQAEKPRSTMFGFLKRKQPPLAVPVQPVIQKEPEIKIDLHVDVDPLSEFVGQVKRATTGTTRVVLRMGLNDLTEIYLKKGGNQAFAEVLSDTDIANFVDWRSGVVEILPEGFSFRKLIEGAQDAIVLLNAPNGRLIEAAKLGASIQSVRSALVDVMSRRNYLMTLSSSKLQKIEKEVTAAWDNPAELEHVLSPFGILHHANAELLANLKDAFVEANSTVR